MQKSNKKVAQYRQENNHMGIEKRQVCLRHTLTNQGPCENAQGQLRKNSKSQLTC